MSASREKKTRQDADNATLSQREQKKIQEERQARRSTIVYTVVGIICVVFAAFLLVWNSGILQRTLPAVTVNGVTYTAADVQYYFNSRRSSEIMSYYLSTYSYPFDTSVSLKDQIYNETTGQTWYDYLMEQTMDTISATTALAAMAEAEGHTISEDSQTALDEELAAVETDWIGAGYSSRDAYLRGLYGSFITYDRYKELLTQDVLVSDYVASVQDSFTYTDEDYQAYYEEHKDELDTLVLTTFTFRAQAQTTDEASETTEAPAADRTAAAEDAPADETADEDEDYGIPMDKVEAVLNATADKAALTPQMQRMMQRQAENTRRVEESIKGTKSNPRWFVPLFCTFMIIGLVWAVVYYLTGNYPIPGIDAWNLVIALGIILIGFLMTMWWR